MGLFIISIFIYIGLSFFFVYKRYSSYKINASSRSYYKTVKMKYRDFEKFHFDGSHRFFYDKEHNLFTFHYSHEPGPNFFNVIIIVPQTVFDYLQFMFRLAEKNKEEEKRIRQKKKADEHNENVKNTELMLKILLGDIEKLKEKAQGEIETAKTIMENVGE